ncbi:MAG: C40 family peptidase [Clostridiales bacterium]|jgi:cell wall-associated NlpC family hydrolase|nr:C40 family peptidase [Clostridiales bacterium]
MKSINHNVHSVANPNDIKPNQHHIARALALGAFFSSCYAVTAFAQQGIVNTDNVNLRTEANPDSSIIGFINAGETVEVTSLVGDYYQVTVNGQERLYIHTEFLDVEGAQTTAPIEGANLESSSEAKDVYASNSRYAIVKSDDGLNLRSDASLDSGIIMALPDGAAVDVVDSWPVWTKVNYYGTVGFMKTEFVELHTGKKPAQPVYNSVADQVISYGKQFVGTPYRWGGTNLSRGVDCSGFVYSVYNHFGVYLNRSSASMAAGNGSRVNKANLQKGDLLFFDTSGGNNGQVSHVGIYMGNGQFIHSSSSQRTWGVTISSLNEAYYIRTYVTAKRVI